MPALRARPGFALLGVLAVIVIVLILAVTAATSVGVVADRARLDLAGRVLAQVMDSSRYSIVRFQADVGEYPEKLTHLRTTLVAGNRDICRNAYTPAERGNWGGPYAIRSVTAAGMWTGIGMARDSLAKDPLTGNPSGGTPHALVMFIDDVDERDAYLLNSRFDPEGELTPNTLGRIRWGTANSVGRVTVQFRKTIIEC